jgi:hypothetical protein
VGLGTGVIEKRVVVDVEMILDVVIGVVVAVIYEVIVEFGSCGGPVDEMDKLNGWADGPASPDPLPWNPPPPSADSVVVDIQGREKVVDIELGFQLAGIQAVPPMACVR